MYRSAADLQGEKAKRMPTAFIKQDHASALRIKTYRKQRREETTRRRQFFLIEPKGTMAMSAQFDGIEFALLKLQIKILQWSGPGLNRRHMDFQSIALPTELPDLIGKGRG
jgi:hypothetical protein